MQPDQGSILFSRCLIWRSKARSGEKGQPPEQSPRIFETNTKCNEASPVLGIVFLVQLAGIYLLDWFFHFEPGDYSMRFWPRIIRAAFVLQVLAYAIFHARQVSRLR